MFQPLPSRLWPRCALSPAPHGGGLRSGLTRLAQEDNKGRFHICGTRIRACQGHMRCLNFDRRYLFRGLRADLSLAPSLHPSLSLPSLSLSPPTALRSCKTSSICSGSPWRRSCRCAPCLHSVDARVSWGARPLLEGRFFWVTRALPCQACTTPLLAPGLASGRRGSGQWTASTPTGARSTRARVEAARRRRGLGRRDVWTQHRIYTRTDSHTFVLVEDRRPSR